MMLRRTALPLALLATVFAAFASAAWSFAESNDLAGAYFIAVAVVALRAQNRIAVAAGAT